MKLVGLVLVRNCFELDYCFVECIQSLLPVCDQICICDGESTDGTQEAVRKWLEREPKLSLCVYPWPNPKGDPDFYVKWIQYGRDHCQGDYVFHLDADEVLAPWSHARVRAYKGMATEPGFSVVCNRLNFWRDTSHLIPHGVCCGHEVIRMAPQGMFLPSDGYHVLGEPVTKIAKKSDIDIMHYGFLRQPEAFFKKAKALQGFFFNDYDPRLAQAETFKGVWSTMPGITGWENELLDYKGAHPSVIAPWLKKRGYNA